MQEKTLSVLEQPGGKSLNTRGFKSIELLHIENARAAWVPASPSIPPALGLGRRWHPRRSHPWVTPHPVLLQGCPRLEEECQRVGMLILRQGLGEPAAGETHSVCASPKVHQSQRIFFFNILFFFFYETVEMTQRFLTQSPFHRKIPNQLLVATDCSHKSQCYPWPRQRSLRSPGPAP